MDSPVQGLCFLFLAIIHCKKKKPKVAKKIVFCMWIFNFRSILKKKLMSLIKLSLYSMPTYFYYSYPYQDITQNLEFIF